MGGFRSVNPLTPNLGSFNLGGSILGNVGINDYTSVANYIDETIDNINISDLENLRYTFFVGGSAFPDRASVPTERKNEFRQLLLKYKPAHTAGFLLIDYV